jgi:hypothetical protein
MPPFDSPEILVPLFITPIVIIILAKAISKYRASYKAKHALETQQAAESNKPTS